MCKRVLVFKEGARVRCPSNINTHFEEVTEKYMLEVIR